MEGRLDRFLRTRPLAAHSIAILLGAAAGTSAPGGRVAFLCAGAAFAALTALLCALRRPLRSAALCGALMFAFAGYAAWRAEIPEIHNVRGADISGIVADMPEWQPERQRAVMRLTDATLNGQRLDYDVRAYVYGARARQITVADRVSVTASAYAPRRSGNGGFDFRSYLWSRGVGQYISVQAKDMRVEARFGGVRESIAELRRALQDRFDRLFPDNAPLLRALLLGDRSMVEEGDEAAFADAGILHLLAVSGLHVSALAAAVTLLGLLLCIPRKVLYPATMVLLAGYAALCGGSPSVVRAALMYCVMLGGRLTRQPNDLLTRLGLACSAMLLINPLYLWQTGFQLSFGAVAGLAALYPTLSQLCDRRMSRSKFVRGLAQGVLGGTAVQLGTLPFAAAAFGRVSWLSLLLNLPCIPLAEVALVLGALAAVVGDGIPMLARWVDGLMGLLASIAHWAANLPFGALRIPELSLAAALLYAAFAALASAQLRTPRRGRALALLMLPVLVMANAAVGQVARQHAGLTVTFLDVGQGDGALVNAEGDFYLVDVGSGDGIVADYVSDQRIDVKAVFLSHAHDDHAGGLEALLEVCAPEAIYLPDGYDGPDADADALAAVQRAKDMGASVMTLAVGDEVALSERVSARVLAPAVTVDPDGGNDVSMVLYMTYGDGSALFTGDLPVGSEPETVPECTVLKVAHHGSASSTSSRFLAQARPALAVISVGADNSYGHPTEAVLNRLATAGGEILRTDERGAITVRIGRDGEAWVTARFPEMN
ncbi:MAG: DNA internalization-related competence protein ComEC/Rec2 [Clostridia bacterium]|nr:DNA internalization-related competence protein ComEC/Rec2 [Clostridia bacterium]